MTDYVPYVITTHTVTGETTLTSQDFSAPVKPLSGLTYTPDTTATRVHVQTVATEAGTFAGAATGYTETVGTDEITYVSNNLNSGETGSTPSVAAAAATLTVTDASAESVTVDTELFPLPITIDKVLTNALYALTAVAMDNSGYSYSAHNDGGTLEVAEMAPDGSGTVLIPTGTALTDEIFAIVPVSRLQIIIYSYPGTGLTIVNNLTRADTASNFGNAVIAGSMPSMDSQAPANRTITLDNSYIITAHATETDVYPFIGVFNIGTETFYNATLVASATSIVGLCAVGDIAYVALIDGSIYAVTIGPSSITPVLTSTTFPDGFAPPNFYINFAVESDNSALYMMGQTATQNLIITQAPGDTTWTTYGAIDGVTDNYSGFIRFGPDEGTFAAYHGNTTIQAYIMTVNDDTTVDEVAVPNEGSFQSSASIFAVYLNQTGTTSFVTWNLSSGEIIWYVPPVHTEITLTTASATTSTPTPTATPSSSDNLLWIILGSVLGAIALALIIYFSVKAGAK